MEACPPSTTYRLRKFARRNKVPLAASVAVLLALLAGSGLAAWQAIVASQERDAAQVQRDEAERQQRIAQENFQRAHNAVDEYLTRVSEEKLLNRPGLQPLRQDLLELALKYYQEFVDQRRDDPALQAELGTACFRLGRITAQIGSKMEALASHRMATCHLLPRCNSPVRAASCHPMENGTRTNPMNPEIFVGRCLFLQNHGLIREYVHAQPRRQQEKRQ